MSYKVGVAVHGESFLSYNALRFATREEAEAYAKNLYSRWTLMTSYEIMPSDDPVNSTWSDNGLKAVDQGCYE